MNSQNLIVKTIKLKEDILELKQKILYIRSKSQSVTQMIRDTPRGTDTFDRISHYSLLLTQMNMLLAKSVRRYVALNAEIAVKAEQLLTPLEQSVVKLKVRKGCSNQAAGRLLNVSASTVQRRYASSLKVFDNLPPDDDTPEDEVDALD